jgi:DNA-directed RNA polymerase subunit M/transcription elongation factor TFIIS
MMQGATTQKSGEQTMECPQCGYEMKVTESLAAPLIAAVERKYQQQMREQQAAIVGREQEVAHRSAELEKKAADGGAGARSSGGGAKATGCTRGRPRKADGVERTGTAGE